MKTITTRGRSVTIPECIDELTPKQYEYYCFLAFALGGKVIDIDYFRVRWFSYLIGLGKSDYTILIPQYIEELESQKQSIDGFVKTKTMNGETQYSLDFNTTTNLLPEYRDLKGPGNWLDGITFGEFVHCLTILESLANADNETVANGYADIARILYHIPEDSNVPDILAYHAPTLFLSVWNAIQAEPIDINGKKIDLRIIFRSSGQSVADDKTGWAGITFEVASAGLFGTVKEVEASDFWEVLLYLYKCKFEYNHNKNISK
ncbi:MAG: hypothetical protein E7082_07320 [Bacteroidales bacterium]|nr:hypothetical protein [Bacteroidales bacterium]